MTHPGEKLTFGAISTIGLFLSFRETGSSLADPFLQFIACFAKSFVDARQLFCPLPAIEEGGNCDSREQTDRGRYRVHRAHSWSVAAQKFETKCPTDQDQTDDRRDCPC